MRLINGRLHLWLGRSTEGGGHCWWAHLIGAPWDFNCQIGIGWLAGMTVKCADLSLKAVDIGLKIPNVSLHISQVHLDPFESGVQLRHAVLGPEDRGHVSGDSGSYGALLINESSNGGPEGLKPRRIFTRGQNSYNFGWECPGSRRGRLICWAAWCPCSVGTLGSLIRRSRIARTASRRSRDTALGTAVSSVVVLVVGPGSCGFAFEDSKSACVGTF